MFYQRRGGESPIVTKSPPPLPPFAEIPPTVTIPRNNPPRQPAHVSDLETGNIRERERERERGG